MPVYTYLPFDRSVISLSMDRDAQRAPGIHLSTIIKDMRITAGIERGQRGKSFTDGEQYMVFEQGFLWERLVKEYIESPENRQIEWDYFVKGGLSQLTADSIENSGGHLMRPGECCLDGIYMNPDAVNLKLWHMEEWKATALRKANFNIEKHRPEWLWQIQAYCKFYHMNRGIFRIWHYGEMPTPDPTQLVVDFSDEELDKNWSIITGHYRHMQERSVKLEGQL